MKIELNTLKVWDKNERLHPCTPERMRELKDSLEKHGQILSLLIDGRDNQTILGGNHQFVAMVELGWKEAEAIIKIPEDDKDAMILGMKHNSHYAEYDIPELLGEIEKLELKDLNDIHFIK